MKQNLISKIFFIILAVVCSTVPSTVQATIAGKASSNASLNRGLVGYWTFDGKDMANGVALDKSGNGHTGLIYNIATSTFYGEGKIGQGLKFDGSNDFIEIGQTSLTNNMTAMSASFWLNTSSFASCGSGNGAIIEKQYFTHGWLLGCINTGYLAMTVYTTGGNGGMTVRTSVPITTNKWKHVVFSWDGDLNGAGAKFYIDGVDSTNLTQAGTGSRINDSTVPLHIARDVYDGQFYGGLMDDVRLYNRALTAAEAKQLYALGATKLAVSSKVTNTSCSSGLSCGLVGYWTFDGKDMANGVALDKSGNGNKGNLANIATSTFYTEGKIGQAGKFDGVDDYVDIANIADNLSEMAVSFWFNYNGTVATDQNQIAVGKIGNVVTGAGWGVFAFGTGTYTGKLAFLTQEAGGANWKQKNTTSTYNDSKWHHFVATLSGGVGGTITIYIDGAPASVTDVSGGGAFSSISNSLNVRIGKNSVTNNPYKGLMDDVRIYNRALSATEIKQLYNAGR